MQEEIDAILEKWTKDPRWEIIDAFLEEIFSRGNEAKTISKVATVHGYIYFVMDGRPKGVK